MKVELSDLIFIGACSLLARKFAPMVGEGPYNILTTGVDPQDIEAAIDVAHTVWLEVVKRQL